MPAHERLEGRTDDGMDAFVDHGITVSVSPFFFLLSSLVSRSSS